MIELDHEQLIYLRNTLTWLKQYVPYQEDLDDNHTILLHEMAYLLFLDMEHKILQNSNGCEAFSIDHNLVLSRSNLYCTGTNKVSISIYIIDP